MALFVESVTKPNLSSGFSEVLPRGAAKPPPAGGDRSGGGAAGLHEGLAGCKAIQKRQAEEKPRSGRHSVRYKYISKHSEVRRRWRRR